MYAQLLISGIKSWSSKNSSVEVASIEHTWYVSSEVVLGAGLAPLNGDPAGGAAGRGEQQHLHLELPQRERVGGVEEVTEEERAKQGTFHEHGGLRRGVRAGALLHERAERVLQQRHAPLGRRLGAGLLPDLDRPPPRHG